MYVRYGLIAFQSTVKGEMYGESGSLWCSVSLGRLKQNLVKVSDVVVDR